MSQIVSFANKEDDSHKFAFHGKYDVINLNEWLNHKEQSQPHHDGLFGATEGAS